MHVTKKLTLRLGNEEHASMEAACRTYSITPLALAGSVGCTQSGRLD
jgi:hypothetical protein